MVGITTCEHNSQLIDGGLEELSSVPKGFSLSIRDRRGGEEIRRRHSSSRHHRLPFHPTCCSDSSPLGLCPYSAMNDCIVHVNN